MPDDTRDDSLDLLRHQRRLAAAARRLGVDAEDLASEAVLRALHRPAPDGRHQPWLERIFRNLVVDHHRRRLRCARALAAAQDEAPAAAEVVPDPEAALLSAERHRWLARAWPRVTPAARAVLDQRFRQERDDSEVAQEMGISATTVRTRIHRALLELRGLLGPLRGFLPLWWFGPQPAALALLPLALSATLATGGVQVLQSGERATPARLAVTAPTSKQRAAPPAAKVEVPAQSPPSAPGKARSTTDPRAARPPVRKPEAGASVQRFDYGDDEVAGDRQRPDDQLVVGPPRRARSPSLIEIPSSFAPAMARTIEDL